MDKTNKFTFHFKKSHLWKYKFFLHLNFNGNASIQKQEQKTICEIFTNNINCSKVYFRRQLYNKSCSGERGRVNVAPLFYNTNQKEAVPSLAWTSFMHIRLIIHFFFGFSFLFFKMFVVLYEYNNLLYVDTWQTG